MAKSKERADRCTMWILKSIAQQIREIAVVENVPVSEVLERDLGPAIAKRHRKLRERQAAEFQAQQGQ